jgi:hypothetical protein
LAAVSDFDSVAGLGGAAESELEPELESELDSEEGVRLDLEDPARSLRAQPLPLKWTAGATIAFFIGPPQTGHADGPWPVTECMTSTSWPQLAQM